MRLRAWCVIALALPAFAACGDSSDDGGSATAADDGNDDGNDDGMGDGNDDGMGDGSGDGMGDGNDDGMDDGATSGSGTDGPGDSGSDSSGGLNCGADANEPNDDQDNAFFLGALSDDDSDGASISGEVEGLADVDWFTYDGSDDFLGVVDPTVDVTSESAVRLCQYAECLSGLAGTEVTCAEPLEEDVSAAGTPGCCQSDAVGFSLVVSCPGASDDATISFFVESEADECVMYTLDYHY